MKLILVEWLDSYGVQPLLVKLTDFTTVLPTMKSVGWLVYENDVLLFVAISLTKRKAQLFGATAS